LICPECANPNEPGRKFCAECGQRLVELCAACGAANTPGAKFCGDCGSPLGAAATVGGVPAGRPNETAAPQPVAQRRLVSVLFADLVGFTSLSEDRDPEEVREILTRYFDTCRALVARYGGTVEKFIGDAVMAVWGTPTTNEDDAERAVRAALDLTVAVEALGEELGIPSIRARAAVLSGEAAVTLGADGQGMVAGDLVNSASRVQAMAGPGDVLVGAETKRATDMAIEYEALGTRKLKGKSEPLEIWRAVRVVGLTGGAQRSGEIEPPFTGRAAELRLLKQNFHATVDERRAQLMSVMGIAGIGKSRLAWEFEKYVDGLALDVLWQRGRCLAYGDGVAFWALAEMVRSRAGIVEDEQSATALPKLRQTVERYVANSDERRFVEPRLAQLLGIEAGAAGDQENLFSAWRLFFERLSDAAPVVLLFEDIHWADPSLLDFIEYLLDWSKDRPIFTLALTRPDLLERRPTWGAARRNVASVLLEPLPPAQIRGLLEGAVSGLPADVSERILERSEGIPFYAVETVRMLIDRGVLVREDGGYRAAGKVETLDVPPTLHALIAARLDGLESHERRLLQDAAVLGRTFTLPALEAVSGSTQDELQRTLGSLVRKEILSLSTDPFSPDRGQYGFLQDLVRLVAYETMSKRDRRPRHIAAAEHLRRAAGGEEDDVIEVIAAHYMSALEGAADGPPTAALRREARAAHIRAGDRAASLAANLVAQRYFERAASLADTPVERAELIERAGLMAAAGVRTAEASTHFAEALRLFEATGSAHPAARVSARLAEIMWDEGRLREGLASMDQAFQLLAEDEPDADLASLAAQIGRFTFFAGDADLATERLEFALQIAEDLDLPEVLSQALNTKSLVLASRARHREAHVLLRHALDVALEHDKPSAALRAYNNLADMACQEDVYAEAQQSVGEALTLARRVGNRYWEQIALGLIYPRYALGDWSGALAAMEELGGWDEHVQSRTAFTQGFVAFGVAIHVHRGDLAAAERMTEAFRDLATSHDHQERCEYLTAQALVALGRGDLDAVAHAIDRAKEYSGMGRLDYRIKEGHVVAIEAALDSGDLDRARHLLDEPQYRRLRPGQRFLRAHSIRLHNRLALAEGADADLDDRWRRSVALFRELASPFWIARTLLEHAEWSLAHDRRHEAIAALDESRSLFGALGAKPWLERVNALSSAAPAVPVA
jgi:predicted ATPase/class 3 adenylate cyclase